METSRGEAKELRLKVSVLERHYRESKEELDVLNEVLKGTKEEARRSGERVHLAMQAEAQGAAQASALCGVNRTEQTRDGE